MCPWNIILYGSRLLTGLLIDVVLLFLLFDGYVQIGSPSDV